MVALTVQLTAGCEIKIKQTVREVGGGAEAQGKALATSCLENKSCRGTGDEGRGRREKGKDGATKEMWFILFSFSRRHGGICYEFQNRPRRQYT